MNIDAVTDKIYTLVSFLFDPPHNGLKLHAEIKAMLASKSQKRRQELKALCSLAYKVKRDNLDSMITAIQHYPERSLRQILCEMEETILDSAVETERKISTLCTKQ